MKVSKNSLFVNKRLDNNNNSTLGVLYLDNKLIGFVIEDEPRDIKVKGETRISSGIYKLGLRRQDTPMTLKYRDKYSWFEYHIELLNVPNFTSIYIHVGNTEGDTMGCQVIGKDATISGGNFANKLSVAMYKEFYIPTLEALKSGKPVYYKIIDN